MPIKWCHGTTPIMRALLARRCIALDKRPGVRPIGIGECRQRLEAKAMALATGIYLQELCAADQLCAGSRLASRLLCTPCGKCLMTQTLAACRWSTLRMHSTALVALPHSGTVGCFGHDAPGTCSLNSYRGYPVVILRGADRSTHVILSREGTTQGCPLAMYAAGVMPLVTKLKDLSRHRQNWFADGSSCGGRLQRVYEWFVNLQALGRAYGYFPESSKSILIVTRPSFSCAGAV